MLPVDAYQSSLTAGQLPRKLQRTVLTKPFDGVSNSGRDNENSDLVIYVNDVLQGQAPTRRYIVEKLLGQGTFGQVVKCVREDTREVVAIKVIKNQQAFYQQARVEVGILQFLNGRGDPEDRHHIVRMTDFFLHANHLCIAFELLSLNLYELIKLNQFRGLSISLVRVFLQQILDALAVLRNCNIIHCDLKPENVLLKGIEDDRQSLIKVIDFGSACFENKTMYSYIQSRFYRSPEVLLGHAYNMAIDMWSLGCIAAELFLGLPLFPGASEHDLLVRIVEMLGPVPDHVLAASKHAAKYFRRAEDAQGLGLGVMETSHSFLTPPSSWQLRTQAEFQQLHGQPAPAGKRYFQHTKLGDIIDAYPYKAGLTDAEQMEQRNSREAFLDFLWGILDPDPWTRWTPRQALQHPFITRARFQGPFQPAPDLPAPTPIPSIPRKPELPPSLGDLGPSQLAAALATSPEAHAQAHAAALAAVHAHFNPPQNSFVARGSAPLAMQAIQEQMAVETSQMPSAHQPMDAQQLHSSYSRPSSGFSRRSQELPPTPTASGAYMPMQSPGSMSGNQAGVPFSPMAISSYPSLGSIPTRGFGGGADFAVGSLEALRGTWHPPHGTLGSLGSQGLGQLSQQGLGSSLSHQLSQRQSSGWQSQGSGSLPFSSSQDLFAAQQQGRSAQHPQQATPTTPSSARAPQGLPLRPQSWDNLLTGRGSGQQQSGRLGYSPGMSLEARASAAYPSLMAEQPLGSGQLLGQSHHPSSHAIGIPQGSLPGEAGVTRLRSRQGSLQEAGPCPSDWDPLYSDDQLLGDEAGGKARMPSSGAGLLGEQLHAPASGLSEGPYDTAWFREASGNSAAAGQMGNMQAGPSGSFMPSGSYSLQSASTQLPGPMQTWSDAGAGGSGARDAWYGQDPVEMLNPLKTSPGLPLPQGRLASGWDGPR